MITRDAIYRAIDCLAKRAGMSREELAAKAGISRSSLAPRVKRGKPIWPSMETLAKLLEASGVSLEEFARMVNGKSEGRS